MDPAQVADGIAGVLERLVEDRRVVGVRLGLDRRQDTFATVVPRSRAAAQADADGSTPVISPAAPDEHRRDVAAAAADVDPAPRRERGDEVQRWVLAGMLALPGLDDGRIALIAGCGRAPQAS